MSLLKFDSEKKAAANSRLASCGVTCLNSSSVFQLGFSAGLTVLYSETPHERQAWERCGLCREQKIVKFKTFSYIRQKK